jgi:FAD-dependent oxidoreductase family protein
MWENSSLEIVGRITGSSSKNPFATENRLVNSRVRRFPVVLLPVFGAWLCLASPALASRGTIQVVDPIRVSAEGSAQAAVLALEPSLESESVTCDVLVVGASTGGVAAALAAAQGNHTVCLTEETYWIGGQMTAQGVSALDDNQYVETSGGTASYRKARDAVRHDYRQQYQLSNTGARQRHFNPGNCWVSALCFEPRVAFDVLKSMLQPYLANRFLRVFLRTKAVSGERSGNTISSVLAYDFENRRWIEFHTRYVLDATDTGELLPLVKAEYTTGAESRGLTGELHARAGSGDPNDVQSFTYTLVLARDPGHEHRLPEPAEYDVHRREQPYTFTLDYGGGKSLTYRMFEKAPGTEGSFWTYRRLVAADNFRGGGVPREISMVNWPGNDYCGPGLLSNDPDEQAQALHEGKLTAIGLVYWFQNEAPRDDGGKGYPELELLTQELGSTDGLSQFPYIRESRRIKALETVREQDLSAVYQKGSRAASFPDSVGIGFYPIDIHSCSKQDFTAPTKPFQIPLGALIPRQVENLLAASKDIGTTHITNGAYRLHPVEWAVGEAAGTLADFALDHDVTPRQVQADSLLTQQLQWVLLERGVPIYWFDDLELGAPAFQAAQFLAARGIFGPSQSNLHFAPGRPLTRVEAVRALARALSVSVEKPAGAGKTPTAVSAGAALKSLTDGGYLPTSFTSGPGLQASLMWSDLAQACEKTGVEAPVDQGTFHPATRSAFAVWLREVYRRQVGLKW